MGQRLVTGLLVLACVAPAQHRVDPRNSCHRIIAVVPMVGKGTTDDPRRPQYVPWPPAKPEPATDIIAFSHLVSDDGRFALVEFVARNRAAFRTILGDRTVLSFEKGRDSKLNIENALKPFRRDFSLDRFGAVLP